ncbi:MAG: NADH-quinone oxidoreductase subunit A [Candidatus Schekmanbacteria bacterium]|nr:NADH-quinone oxidoreductase subunit A [Candidatus Schekmanbacteria bacterium]
MLAHYFPIFVFTILAFVVGIAAIRLGGLVRPSHPDRVKLSPYECGLKPIHDLPHRNTVPFYLLSMLFLLFDVEILFFFPWVLFFERSSINGFASMLLFMFILFVGYLYAWKKGALEWRH